MMRILFLDFDGVLHPVPGVPTDRVLRGKPVVRAGHGLPFEWLPILCGLLRPHPDVRIIVHSSWRLVHAATDVREMLGELADRFVACAPHGPRWDCVRAVLDTNTDITDYCILDDAAEELASAPSGRVILCDPYIGISDPRVQRRLQAWLAGPAGALADRTSAA